MFRSAPLWLPVLPVAVVVLLTAPGRGQAFCELLVGQPSTSPGPTTYRIVLPEPGTFSLHDAAVFLGQPVPPVPLPPAFGGMAFDHGMRSLVVTNGPLFWMEPTPHLVSAPPPIPPIPWPPGVSAQLVDLPVDIAFRSGTEWILGTHSGRFLGFDHQTFQPTGPVRQVAGLANIAGFDDLGWTLVAVDAAGTRYEIDQVNWTVISVTAPSAPLPSPVVDFAMWPGGNPIALLQNGTVVNLAAVHNPIATGVNGSWLASHPVTVRRSQCGSLVGRFRPLAPNLGGIPDAGLRLQNAAPNRVGVFGVGSGWAPGGVPVGVPISSLGCNVNLGGSIAALTFVTDPAGVATFQFGLPRVAAPGAPFTIQVGMLNGSSVDVTDALALQVFVD
jgi:hypothetical protein